jgi:hypothetical protein
MSFAIRVSSLDHAPTVSATKLTGKKEDRFCRDFPCCRLSHKALYLLSAAIWTTGLVICALKGADNLVKARDLGATRRQQLGALLGGISAGLVLGHFAFSYIAKKTIDRIEMLERTYWHASYNWRFYIFLVVINLTLQILEKFVWHDKIAYLFYSTLDLQVSVSLLYSLHVFVFNWRTFGLKNRFATGLGEPLLYADEEDSEDERNFISASSRGAGHSGVRETLDDDDPLSMKNILISGATAGALEGREVEYDA